MSKSEIRKDYFKDQYVIIAPNRAKRPHRTGDITETVGICPFCPDKLEAECITYQSNNHDGDWEIVSVVNKYSALTLDNDSAYGQAEVIVESRKHNIDINEFSIDHIVRVINAYTDRFMNLRKIDGIKHVIVFKNEGGKAGASIAHTHSQVIAMPILPPKVENEARDYNEYRLEHGSCPYCDIIALESDRPRVIWQDENIMALSPYASEAPYGVWLLPKRHMCLMDKLNHSEKESIATALKIVLGKLDECGISYNYFFENAVNSEDYHMHIKIAPRPNIWAGLELGTGVVINPISPEFATKIYRGEIEIDDNPRF